ncbi:MAG: GtrA family protein [Tannerellaceae bacterium]|jgi:putative flippase GtrA|nr:GtrA family protein [Tannerellaceae bacterium]
MTSLKSAKTFLIQASKYAIVGMGNTLLTFAVYYLLTEIFHLSPSIANPAGYALGLANSFVWNRRWTFGHSGGAWIGSALKFFAVFAVCFAIQYTLCLYLDAHLPIKHYYNFIIAMIVYNLLFFLGNKYIIFKTPNQ